MTPEERGQKIEAIAEAWIKIHPNLPANELREIARCNLTDNEILKFFNRDVLGVQEKPQIPA